MWSGWAGWMHWWRRRQSAGVRGERCAAQYLRRRGYQVVARNWRSPRDRRNEIDLVCRDGDVLVFVEVKTRTTSAACSGYQAVDQRKKRILLRAADTYLRGLAPVNRPRTFRFDIVAVETPRAGDGAPQVRHYENVHLFPKFYWR